MKIEFWPWWRCRSGIGDFRPWTARTDAPKLLYDWMNEELMFNWAWFQQKMQLPWMNASFEMLPICTKSLGSCFNNAPRCLWMMIWSRKRQCVWRKSKKIERESLKKIFRSENVVMLMLNSVRIFYIYELLIMSLITIKPIANGLVKTKVWIQIWIMHLMHGKAM